MPGSVVEPGFTPLFDGASLAGGMPCRASPGRCGPEARVSGTSRTSRRLRRTHAGDLWRDWATNADDAVALLRASAGRDPYDRRLTDLVGELATRSEDFRVPWASHDVRTYVTGVKRIHHPLVGDLELPFETSPVGADPGQYLLFYTAEPDSRSHEALTILASWSTSDQLLDASHTDTDTS